MEILSSRFTVFQKFVMPFVCPLILAVWALVLALDGWLMVGLLVLAIPMSLFHYSLTRELKQVAIGGNFVFVSDFHRRIRFPVSQIKDVKAIWKPWLNHLQLICIQLDKPTAFGDEIVFEPDDTKGARIVLEQLRNYACLKS
jgi:hypothetical protein